MSFFYWNKYLYRVRDAREIRYQTDLRVSVASLAYSPLYGNKIRKLWKLLAKNNELTDNSYDFDQLQVCKVLFFAYFLFFYLPGILLVLSQTLDRQH